MAPNQEQPPPWIQMAIFAVIVVLLLWVFGDYLADPPSGPTPDMR